MARKWLLSRGYDILKTNYICKLGEIDIIAIKDYTVVFVEVKTRMRPLNSPPLEVVDLRKRERLKRVALHCLSEMAAKFGSTASWQVRFDVAAVIVDWQKKRGHLYWFEDAF